MIIAYNYVYQDHRNIEEEKPAFNLLSVSLIKEFGHDPIASEHKYLNKTVTITGKTTEINGAYITLDSGIFCQLKDSLRAGPIDDQKLTIKGRIIGYDDILEQVKLDQCTITTTTEE